MLRSIVSGGQTGVDRAALDWAFSAGWDCGGWCPAGRIAEDGEIEKRYPLKETPASEYSQRTEWNVRDSAGTAIFTRSTKLVGGTKLTKKFASKWNRPCLVVRESEANSTSRLRTFVEDNRIEILNIAGPRESTEPELDGFVREALADAFGNYSPEDYGSAND